MFFRQGHGFLDLNGLITFEVLILKLRGIVFQILLSWWRKLIFGLTLLELLLDELIIQVIDLFPQTVGLFLHEFPDLCDFVHFFFA